MPAIVGWLLDRSFGNRGAVSVPDRGDDLGPRGPFPSGVGDLIDHVAATHRAGGPHGREHWAFLIGAPGNGKSESLRELARQVGLTFPRRPDGGKAPRSYDFAGQGAPAWTRLVNDASIRRADVQAGRSLRQDIVDGLHAAARGRALLFVNVNRGVLVEEAEGACPSDRSSGDPEAVAADMVYWLNQVASGEAGEDPSRAYYQCKAFDGGHGEIVAHALVLDCTSLFEPLPGQGRRAVEFDEDGNGVASPYQPVGSTSGDRSSSIAVTLLGDVLSAERWEQDGCGASCTASQTCPFVANVRWLRDPRLFDGYLGLSRAAEVASGRRMTYRDLLGHVALAVLGRVEDAWLAQTNPCAWVQEQVDEVPTSASAAGKLASHRIYTSLFPAPSPASGMWKRGQGAISPKALTALIVDDFGKPEQGVRGTGFASAFGRLDPCKSVDGWEGHRFATLDAAEAMHVQPPTAWLEELGALPPAALSGVETALDEAVAGTLRQATTGASTRHRMLQARSWRTILLLRQVGLASGRFADHDAVEAWLSAQSAALDDTGQGTLAQGLQAMLVPRQGALLMAPYRPRTRAFGANLPPNTLYHRHPGHDLRVDVRAVKDGIQAVLWLHSGQQGHELVPVPVDLDLAREAVVAARETVGFTDLPDRCLARVERARASLMSHGRLSSSSNTLHLTDAGGNLHRVRGNLGNVTLQEVRG